MKYFQNISNLWGNVLTALGNTVYISLIAIVLGTILGIAMGVVLTYCKKRWQWLFRIYVDIMRGLPVLVTIFVVCITLSTPCSKCSSASRCSRTRPAPSH